jgi:hypothetical protein
MRPYRLFRCVVALLSSLVCGSVAHAQGDFLETFDNVGETLEGQDGPTNLVSRGFIFRNLSSPRGATSWHDGYLPDAQPFWPAPQAGPGYIAVQGTSAAQFGGRVSNWMILPAVPNQRAGDVLTFYVNNIESHNTPTLQVRYSSSGGTNPGATADSVGHFSTLLLDINPIPVGGWLRYEVTLPGPGRVAFRYYIEDACNFGCAVAYTGMDTLSIGAPPPPPCNLPPIPQAGETAIWRAADSPYDICSDLLIPPGATVIVEPDVVVNVRNSSTLGVAGTLRGSGTAEQPIVFDASANFPPAIEINGGTVDLAFAQFAGQVRPSADGTLILADSLFAGPRGLIFSPLYASNGFARIERTTLNDSELTIGSYTVVLRDVTLNNSFARLGTNHLFFDRLSATGGGIDFGAWSGQPVLIDTVDVRNAPYGISLGGGNFFVGPDVTLVNNTYPVHLGGGGILPGSVLPPTGNVNNRIFVPGGDTSGGDVWANAGLPYYVDAAYSQRGSRLTILPGVVVEMSPVAGMAADPSPIRILGTEEAPVRFEPAIPGAPWFPLQNVYRIRHAELRGARRAAAWPSQLGWGFVDSSLVADCTEFGLTGQVQVRKTRFINNAVGASVNFNDDLLGITNPNSFEGNGVGVAQASDARYNWWNSPTGPTSPSNPGGTGDPVGAFVPFEPFLSSPPDFENAPPIVDIERHSFFARPGTTMILSWKARDDDTIVSQRVLMSLDGDIVQDNLFEPVLTLADNLGPEVRAIEFTVPEPSVRFFGEGNIRVEVTDSAGQVGWDDIHIYLERDEPGQLTFTTGAGGPYTAGDVIGEVCWMPEGIKNTGGSVDAYLLLENSNYFISLGGVTTYLDCLPLTLRAPFVSTDRARIVLSLFTGGGVGQPEFYFSEPFTIRADPRVEDAAPTVEVSAPAPGSRFVSGETVPIRWTAADDQFVRNIHIQASYDGGRTWNFIARDLPGDAGSFDWTLPTSQGIPDVRLKVVAVDRHFQDSSDATDIAIGVGGVPCRPDIDHDGVVTSQDFFDFLTGFFAGNADFNNDAVTNSQDFFDFLTAFFAGC